MGVTMKGKYRVQKTSRPAMAAQSTPPPSPRLSAFPDPSPAMRRLMQPGIRAPSVCETEIRKDEVKVSRPAPPAQYAHAPSPPPPPPQPHTHTSSSVLRILLQTPASYEPKDISVWGDGWVCIKIRNSVFSLKRVITFGAANNLPNSDVNKAVNTTSNVIECSTRPRYTR